MLKSAAKSIARATLGKLPPPASRLSGPLAIKGGKPVRDLRLRPFASAIANNMTQWLTSVGPAFRAIFLSGVEGLPQPRAREFEKRWAEYCGCKHALMLPHGTDALRVGLAAAFDHDGLAYGGEVIVPNLSFIASATACLDRRFGVALVDVDSGSLQLDPARVEEAIIPGRTVAILPVHQFGQPADMTALMAIAKRHNLKVIEDAAQAHGAQWETGMVGAIGDAGAFSFQSSKNLSCGEGGVLTTNDDDIIARARSLYNAGRAPDGGGRWEHPGLGWNIRPTEYQAALLLHRLAGFDALQRRRAENFAILDEKLRDVASLRRLEQPAGVKRHGMYMYAMRYRPDLCGGAPVTAWLAAMSGEGAPVNRLYAATISGQPAFLKLAERRPDYIRALPTPVADEATENTIYIAHHVFLGTPADMSDIAAAAGKVEAHFSRNRQ